MSKTFARSASSAGVSRSNSRVPRPARFKAAATDRLRGLWRLLPEPWANITTAPAPPGRARSPDSRTPPASTSTSSAPSAAFPRACAACASCATTSSSEVWVKFSYHSPTARNICGTDRHTTSSASCSAGRPRRVPPPARPVPRGPRPVPVRPRRRPPPWHRSRSRRRPRRPSARGARRGRSPRNRRARRSSSASSARSTATRASSRRPLRRTMSSLMTRAPPSPMAPKPSSRWYGTPSLRTTTTSRGAPSVRATSKATGTPPRGRPSTTGPSAFRCRRARARRRPASTRSVNSTVVHPQTRGDGNRIHFFRKNPTCDCFASRRRRAAPVAAPPSGGQDGPDPKVTIAHSSCSGVVAATR